MMEMIFEASLPLLQDQVDKDGTWKKHRSWELVENKHNKLGKEVVLCRLIRVITC